MARLISERHGEAKQQLVLELALAAQGLDRLRRPAPHVDDVVEGDAGEGAAPVVDPRRTGDDAAGGAGRIAQRRLVADEVFLDEFAPDGEHQAVLEGAPVPSL